MGKDLYEIGEIPPVGEVPKQMHAQLVRPDRFGDPKTAILDEVVDVPELGPHDALVMVMAAGVNFNNVWAARGMPVDVTKGASTLRASRPTSTSAAPTPPASSTPWATRSRTSRSATRSSCTPGSGTSTTPG